MPRVTFVYRVTGHIYREYEVPQKYIDQGAAVADEHVWDKSLEPVSVLDNTELEFVEMRVP